MRVRMLTGRAGPWGSNSAGEIVDLPEDVARAYVRNLSAEYVEPMAAAIEPTEIRMETAAAPVARRRGRPTNAERAARAAGVS